MFKKLLSILTFILIISCVSRKQKIDIVFLETPKNINNLNTKLEKLQQTEKKVCNNTILIFPISFKDLKETSVIKKSIKENENADAMTNISTNFTSWIIPLIYGRSCMQINGELVKIYEN